MRAAPPDIQQRLRQARPIGSLQDLGVAACEAARLVRDGIVGRAEAADVLYRMAEGAGLVLRYGDDVVQGYISAGFEAIKIEPNHANGARFEDWDSDHLDAHAQGSGGSHGADPDAEDSEPPQGKRVAVLRRASNIEPEPLDVAALAIAPPPTAAAPQAAAVTSVDLIFPMSSPSGIDCGSRWCAPRVRGAAEECQIYVGRQALRQAA